MVLSFSSAQTEQSSFRDPAGKIFYSDGKVLRTIEPCYQENYDLFQSSGLSELLLKKKLIIPFQESSEQIGSAYKVLEVKKVEVISYPYEWSFQQLKDAALLTLRIQELAMQKGMNLKDASAFNIQFHQGKAVLIDLLSFEKLDSSKPWVAYRQFCQHFLIPLSLSSYCDLRLSSMGSMFIDGVPLEMAPRLLPLRAKFNFGLYLHIFMHSKSQFKHRNDNVTDSGNSGARASKNSQLNIVRSLKATTLKLKNKDTETEWGDYYANTNYSDSNFQEKQKLVDQFIQDCGKKDLILDLGANQGVFSKIAAKYAKLVVAADIDRLAINLHHNQLKKEKVENILPLFFDYCTPTPAIGWSNIERPSFFDRIQPDVICALAIVHHLAIGNNLPLDMLAKHFSEMSEQLIIEFVPKSDGQTQKLLRSREDIFPDYTLEGFEKAFQSFFKVMRKEQVGTSDRILYYMQRL